VIQLLPEIVKRIHLVGRELRENGVSVSTDDIVNAIDSVFRVKPDSVDKFKFILKINMVKNVDNYIIFDAIFDKYFPEFSEDYTEKLEKIENAIEEKEKEYSELKDEVSDLEKKKEVLEYELEEAEEEGDIESEEDIKKEIENVDNKIEDIENKLESIEKELKNLNEAYNMIKDLQKFMDMDFVEEYAEEEIEKDDTDEDELKKEEEIIKEKLGTEEIGNIPEVESEQERIHGGEEIHLEVPESREIRLGEEEGISGRGGGGGGARGKEGGDRKEWNKVSKSIGIKPRPNATAKNNSIMREIQKNSVGKYGERFINNILNNELHNATIEMKNLLLNRFYDKKSVENTLSQAKNYFREIISKLDGYSIKEKKEIYAELIRRVNRIATYEYNKIILQEIRERGITLNIDKMDLKNDLTMIYNINKDLYNTIIKKFKTEIKRLARLFKLKKSKMYKRAKKGELDIKRTIHYNLTRYGKNILELKYRTHKLKKSNLFVLCDISYSVNHASELFLLFIDASRPVFNKVLTYVFVDMLYKIENKNDLKEAYSIMGRNYSDMRYSFYQLNKIDIPEDYIVIVLTDCRNNGYDDDDYYIQDHYTEKYFISKGVLIPKSYQTLKEIKDKVKNLIILNPEPKDSWGTGDSEAYEYINYSGVPIFEFYNLETLKRSITKLEKII